MLTRCNHKRSCWLEKQIAKCLPYVRYDEENDLYTTARLYYWVLLFAVCFNLLLISKLAHLVQKQFSQNNYIFILRFFLIISNDRRGFKITSINYLIFVFKDFGKLIHLESSHDPHAIHETYNNGLKYTNNPIFCVHSRFQLSQHQQQTLGAWFCLVHF